MSRSALSNAGRQLRQRLISAGLHPRTKTKRQLSSYELPSAVLAGVLPELGPLFAAFGRYLSRRPDLLPFGSCLALSSVENHLSATPSETVRSLLSAQGAHGAELLAGFNDEPIGVSSLYQWHRAQLDENKSRIVKIVRPELERQAADELDLLSVFGEFELCDEPGASFGVEQAIADFRIDLERRLNLGGILDSFSSLDEWVTPGEELTLIPDDKGFRFRNLVVLCPPEGDLLGSKILSSGDRPDNADVARQLVASWSHLALVEGVCLEDVDPWDIVLRPGDRLAICCAVVSLPDRESRQDALRYLTAAAQHEPDRAGDALIRLSEGQAHKKSRDFLRVQMRQASVFREGLWSDTKREEQLAPTMFLHWRLARRCGYVPSTELAAFERGAAALALLAERLDDEVDSFEHGVADTRVVAAAVDLRRSIGPTAFPGYLRRLFTSFDTLTHFSDHLALDGNDYHSSDLDDTPSRSSGSGSWWKLALLLLAMLGIAAVARFTGTVQSIQGWVEPLAVVFILGLVFTYILILELSGRHRDREHHD